MKIEKIATGAAFAKAPLAGAMPGVQQEDGEEFVMDGQLPGNPPWFLKASRAVVCDLEKFRQMASALGIECPADEKSCNVPAVARAVSETANVRTGGDLVVMMSEADYVVADATTGVIAHVGLTRSARARVRASLGPAKTREVQNRFVAVFTAEHARLQGVPTENSRALHAARRALLEAVRSCCRMLHPDRSWIAVRIFAERFEA